MYMVIHMLYVIYMVNQYSEAIIYMGEPSESITRT